METWVAVLTIVASLTLMFVFPSAFLHPVLTWHRLILGHDWEIVPVGFADWDIHCSCGKVGQA